MEFRRPRACLALLLLGQLLAAGCHDRSARDADGGDDAGNSDAAPAGDALAPLALDFSATGCADFNLTLNRCTGPAPLTVRFSPIGSPTVNRFLWDFGDGTAPSTERAPAHTYTLPRMYTVSLVGASVTGSLSRVRPQFIAVAAASLGELCDVDAQCATGLRCLCGSAATCGGAFSRGICTVACGTGPCTGGAVCANLALGLSDDPAPPPLPFQDVLCLAPCDSDRTCARGLTCRDLPAGGGGVPAWVRGCFAPVPLDVGASCRAPDGTLSGNLCTSGRCADLGALGLCSATCTAASDCPPSTACARFDDGRQLCLRTCAAPTDCGVDPLIACQASGAAAGSALAFTLTAGGPASACGPRSCQTTDDCSPAGVCQGGSCRPQPEPSARAR